MHGTHSNYSSLRIFGSKCFPYTWDTRRHKFDPKTIICVFVGYSDRHKGYKCFHPSSKKLFISRHVVFDELCFPYKTNHHNTILSSTPHVVSVFDSWLPHTNSNSCAGSLQTTSTPPCSSPLPTILMHFPTVQNPVGPINQPEQTSPPEVEHLEYSAQPSTLNQNLIMGLLPQLCTLSPFLLTKLKCHKNYLHIQWLLARDVVL